MSTEKEMLCGYIVHPAASVFPLIEADEFDGLVDSICRNGIQHPIVVRGGELLDGRNRLRAAEVAKQMGFDVAVPVAQWKDDGRNVAEWIWDTNAMRRQLSDDGVALAGAAIYPMISAENEARQKAARFKKGESPNPAGRKGKEQVETKSSPPVSRDTKSKDAASTVGQVAAKAGTSMHKARQAIAVQKAITAGELPAETAKEVMAGKKKLREVLPKKPKAKPEPSHRGMNAILRDMRDLIAEWREADHNVEVLKDELKTQMERL